MDPFSIGSIETQSAAWEQFASEVGGKAAANYIARHEITEPPRNPEEALKMARKAVAEYIAGI